MPTEQELRDSIVTEAKTWLNTPYHDFAGVKGVGVDCAWLPLRVYQAVGLIPKDFSPPWYSPQQWLNSSSQTDKFKLRFEDTTFLNIVKQFTKREISIEEIQPGDFVIVKIAASWTHGAIVVKWPDYLIHPIKGLGVIGSPRREGFWANRPMRFFSLFDKAVIETPVEK